MNLDKKERLLRKEALEYHEAEPRGKIKVVPTKPHSTAHELSLAYSPGVAYPCLDIAERPEDAYRYTSKGNLVAVISNGTAVLGLGNYRSTCEQTGDGRERPLVEDVCRYRCF